MAAVAAVQTVQAFIAHAPRVLLLLLLLASSSPHSCLPPRPHRPLLSILSFVAVYPPH